MTLSQLLPLSLNVLLCNDAHRPWTEASLWQTSIIKEHSEVYGMFPILYVCLMSTESCRLLKKFIHKFVVISQTLLQCLSVVWRCNNDFCCWLQTNMMSLLILPGLTFPFLTLFAKYVPRERIAVLSKSAWVHYTPSPWR